MNSDCANSNRILIELLCRTSRHQEAAEIALHHLRLVAAQFGEDSAVTSDTRSLYGGILIWTGRVVEAEEQLLRAFAVQSELPAADFRRRATAERLVRVYDELQRPQEAERFRAELRAGAAGEGETAKISPPSRGH